MTTKQDTYRCTCATCGKRHDVDRATFQEFGAQAQCLKCVDYDHLRFMQTTGRRLGMTCVAGCLCGFGPK